MECPYCKTKNPEGARYCGTCGKFNPSIPNPVSSADIVKSRNGSRSGLLSLTPGTRLQGGRYIVKKPLGQGGTLLAMDIRLDNKLVVIKELISDNADPIQFQDDVRHFKHEVATLIHIDHPLVPNVTDHFQMGMRYFIVQDYVEGENLEEYMNHLGQPIPEQEALSYASEVLDVLDYLAQQRPPIIHRDIKPTNIVIGAKDKHAHLVNFGIAQVDIARNMHTSPLDTPSYAPPEQYEGNTDPRSDLYSLAASLHHMLTNHDPRDTPFNYPAARLLNPQLSPETEQVLTHALINDIDQRYQSAAAMKQDIDDILQQHFGVSGNINTYMLGASGVLKAIPRTSSSDLPTIIHPPTQAAIPTRRLQQSSYSAPGQPPANPHNRRPSWFGNRRLILLGLLALLLVIATGVGIFSYFGGQKSPPPPTGIGVTAKDKATNDFIGISDGTFIFDTIRVDSTLKQQAADKQRSGDLSAATSLFKQSTELDTNDAEALIYLENLRVLSSGSPYVTMVVATMLSPDNIGVGHDDLQGAYVAQKEFNDGFKLTSNFKVRLLIASSGSKAVYANQVAQQIVQVAHSDHTFAGVMGWPFSSRMLNAVSVLGAAHIPMVSQTSSSDQLTGISPYFFRVVPANKIQGIAGARYAEQILHANTVALFVDVADTYSQSLANDFKTQFEADGKKIIVTENYTVDKPATLPPLVQDALGKHPDLIYFSGFAADMGTLLTDLPPGNVPVMGGDALYELGGYHSSARANFNRLRFTAFAYPDEWVILGRGDSLPLFFSEYPAAFDPAKQHPGYGYTRPDNDVILSYDAMVALLQGCNIVLSTGKQQATSEELQQALTQIQGANALQGIGGQIAFGPDGDPVNKAIVILSVDPSGHIKMELPIQGGPFFK